MKKWLSLLLVLCLLASMNVVLAEEAPTEIAAAAAEEEPLSITRHSAEIDGQTINYTATTGRLSVMVNDSLCEMFFTAYTMDGVEDVTQRPVTFAFNGGPGSASLWLHLGMLGPRRVDVNEDGEPTQLPVRLVDNPCSILDMTDLVFIDPVGTGYSRPVEGVDPVVFYTYEDDIDSVGEFIRLYTTRNGRWGSPKYVAGESYGTTRAVGVSSYLSQRYGMGLNGVMLISCVNDFSLLMESSELSDDLTYALYLPTYAAIARYHGVLDEAYQSMPLEDFLDEVRDFAGGEYQAALFKGARLTEAELDDVAGKVAAYIGYSKEDVKQSNLRIYIDDFCSCLLKAQKLMVGRLDGRFTGPITAGNLGSGEADPSDAVISDAFGTAINQYIDGELDYHTNLIYECMSIDVISNWKYDLDNATLDQKTIINSLMSRNRSLKLWVLCGYYDLATPFFPAEYTYDHIFLKPEARENLSFTYYPSGHMIYMHQPSLEQFRRDAEAWYKGK